MLDSLNMALKYMQEITKGVLEGQNSSWRTKFRTIGNTYMVVELLERLQKQQIVISVVIGLLHMCVHMNDALAPTQVITVGDYMGI